jgi:type IV pilus assembly protein PilE
MSLVEVAIVIVIIGILLSLVVPAFNRVGEQNRVDSASQYLRSLWAAERVYWLENKTFTNSMAALDALNLIDPKILAGSDGHFTYVITAADATTFTITATRADSDVWTGTLTINQDGTVAGALTGSGGSTLSPSEL